MHDNSNSVKECAVLTLDEHGSYCAEGFVDYQTMKPSNKGNRISLFMKKKP